MASRRAQKAAEAIRAVVSTSILQEIKDPRVQHVTVTYVEVANDLRSAKVHVSVMGTDTEQNLCLHGLQSAAGFLQSRVAERIDMRYTPRLQFLLDQGVKRSIEIATILREVLPDDADGGAGEPGEPGEPGETGETEEPEEREEPEETEETGVAPSPDDNP